MKQVIGIYCGNKWFTNWDEHSLNEGIGGSETWAIELASVFQRWGFHVIIFGQPTENHFAENGVEYVKSTDFEKRCEYQHFDYFISSRMSSEITPSIPSCNNIYLMGHDTEIELRYDTPVLKLDRVKKIMLLSEWQKRVYLANYTGLTEDRILMTCNGVDKALYQDVDKYWKENCMVWSSSPERGLFTFVRYFFPKIKARVPDFKLKVCGYNMFLEYPEFNNNDIEFLGKIGKPELAELQKSSKIWIYPNIGKNDNNEPFHETFCITAVENALAKNAIVCFKAGGLVSTLKSYEHMLHPECFNELGFNFNESSKNNALYDELIEVSIKMLTDESCRKQAVDYLYKICQNYTWEQCAKDWLKEWGLMR